MTTLTQSHAYSAAIDSYERGAATLRNAARGLSTEQLNTRLAPGTWSIKEVIVHMVDSDQAASHRMRRIAAEDMPLLVSYDENAFIARLDNTAMDANEALDRAARENTIAAVAQFCRSLIFARGDNFILPVRFAVER